MRLLTKTEIRELPDGSYIAEYMRDKAGDAMGSRELGIYKTTSHCLFMGIFVSGSINIHNKKQYTHPIEWDYYSMKSYIFEITEEEFMEHVMLEMI